MDAVKSEDEKTSGEAKAGNEGLRTWETKLEPTIFPPVTNFKYKRVLLPAMVYRTEYDRENRHLPSRLTRADYANLFFSSVAKNDVETTRAFLNAGVSPLVMTDYGETALSFAMRSGAIDVAALLNARGAQE